MKQDYPTGDSLPTALVLPSTPTMVLTIRKTDNKDRVLQYGTVAATLLKDIGNASNQPYLQAIASVSLLIMETVQVRRS
jgi:hypothetical protein